MIDLIRGAPACTLGNVCELRDESCADIVHFLTWENDASGNAGAAPFFVSADGWGYVTAIGEEPLALRVFSHETGHMLVRTRLSSYFDFSR